MLKCPNCNEETIKKSSKFWLGAARSITCTNCNAKVSIPYMSLFLITIFFPFIYLIPKFEFKYSWLMIIILSICFIYLNYKFVPLIVKLKENEIKTKEYHIKRISISLIYFILTFSLIMKILFGDIGYFTRRDVLNDMNAIDEVLIELRSDIFSGNELKDISDDLIYQKIKSARRELLKIQYRYKHGYMFIEHIEVDISTGLDLLVNKYDNLSYYEADDMEFLHTYIKMNNDATYIRDIAVYKLSFNPLAKFKLPIEVREYFRNLENVINEYK